MAHLRNDTVSLSLIASDDKTYQITTEDKIEAIDVATPMTIVRYTNNWKGSYMGWANPFSAKTTRILPKLKNFFMIGQWVGDTGVSGAAKGGRDSIEFLCNKDKKKFISSMI